MSPVVLVEAVQSKTQQEVSSFTLKTMLNGTVSSRPLLSLISITSSLRGAMAASKKGYLICEYLKNGRSHKVETYTIGISVPSSTTYQNFIFCPNFPFNVHGTFGGCMSRAQIMGTWPRVLLLNPQCPQR